MDFPGSRRSYCFNGRNPAVGRSVTKSRGLAEVHGNAGGWSRGVGESLRRPGRAALALFVSPRRVTVSWRWMVSRRLCIQQVLAVVLQQNLQPDIAKEIRL